MKRHFSKLTALILSLSLALSLALPAFADDTPPAVPGPSEEWDSGSTAEKEWIAAHPEEVAAFDPYAYFSEEYFYYNSPEEYMEYCELTQEAFEQKMLSGWVQEQLAAEERAAWVAAHPEEVAAFDADAYFAEAYKWYDSVQDYLDTWDMTRAEFEQDMLDRWVSQQVYREKREKEIAEFKAKYPEECAAFDPYAYFGSIGYSWYDDAWDYMEQHELTEEEFCREMFLDWMDDFKSMAEDKELFGGSVRGINVMVNGQCIPFPDARPELKNDRTMVPLRSAMEYLGAQVDYDQEAGTAQVSMDGLSFTHVIGTDALTMSDGSTVKMDVPSYIQDGRTMVPVRFFSEVLGYEVLWDQSYQTAVLLDRQKLIDGIDQDFTLLNRVLYAASGADQVKEGQALEQTVGYDLDLTLFDTLHGDKKIPVKLSGSALADDRAIELHLSGDLSGLIDCMESIRSLLYLDDQETAQLRAALSGFSADVIVNLELGAIYFHCPALIAMNDELGDPDAWYGVPVDLSALSGLGLSLSALPQLNTVGQIICADDAGSPFWRWSTALGAAAQLEEYVGDSRFTKSGSSYVMSIQDSGYDWPMDGYDYTLKATVTPSGEKSCTYSVTFDLTADDMAANASLNGSSGKTDLELSFHLKNTFKFTLEGASRTAGSDKSPLSEPPKGSKIEFPAGPVGSGSL